MRKMETKYLIITLLTFVFTSCSTNVELENYIDKSAPFQLTIYQLDSETGLTTSKKTELSVKSEKWKKLIEWIEKNEKDWKSAPASYIGNVYVTQGKFRIIYSKDGNGIVIGLIDSNGNPKQYRKGFKKGELDFLTK
jgi:flagellar hook assembly protein FlgD